MTVDSLPEEFFIDLAVGVNSFLEICDNHGIDELTANTLQQDPKFQRRLRIATQAVEDDGSAFRARCRTAVAANIDTVMHMMKDPDVSASIQLDAFKTLVRYGGLEPAKAEATVSAGPGLTLNIIAPDGSQAVLNPMSPSRSMSSSSTSTSTGILEGDFIEAPDDYDEKPLSAGSFAAKAFGAA